MRILLVDDDAPLRTVLTHGLEEAGYVVDALGDAESAREYLLAYDYGVCILDWRLPGAPGVDLLQWMRGRQVATPVIMLTARDLPADRVEGLDAGADDYLVKPFHFEELLARLRALLRRPEGSRDPVLRFGGLVIDPASQIVTVDGEKVDLTRRELAIVELLLRRRTTVVDRRAIALHAWPDEAAAVGSNTIDVHIARLRAKLARSGARIETVRGVGYRLVAQ